MASLAEDEEEDYMSMAIPDCTTAPSQPETSVQRRARKQREAEGRARQTSKAELARQTEAKRDEALNTSLPKTSKGYQMMARLGFKAGSALGKEGNEHARTEPLDVVVKEGRAGVGMEGERKRKFREMGDDVNGPENAKKRETESQFRDRQGKEREERRAESMCWSAMRVLESFETKPGENQSSAENDGDRGRRTATEPTKQINVLWRGLVRDRQEKEQERRMRYDLHQSLSRNATYDDAAEDKQDQRAWGTEEEELEEEDQELDQFKALEPAERLRRMVIYLREKWRYCLWCKCQYPDETMDGCPGLGEDEHG
ncbi:MAG: hypothetical protein Q9183_000675 [Haloplaca sp. 2 TL-2023]